MVKLHWKFQRFSTWHARALLIRYLPAVEEPNRCCRAGNEKFELFPPKTTNSSLKIYRIAKKTSFHPKEAQWESNQFPWTSNASRTDLPIDTSPLEMIISTYSIWAGGGLISPMESPRKLWAPSTSPNSISPADRVRGPSQAPVLGPNKCSHPEKMIVLPNSTGVSSFICFWDTLKNSVQPKRTNAARIKSMYFNEPR